MTFPIPLGAFQNVGNYFKELRTISEKSVLLEANTGKGFSDFENLK
jgi:hypothetical protein